MLSEKVEHDWPKIGLGTRPGSQELSREFQQSFPVSLPIGSQTAWTSNYPHATPIIDDLPCDEPKPVETHKHKYEHWVAPGAYGNVYGGLLPQGMRFIEKASDQVQTRFFPPYPKDFGSGRNLAEIQHSKNEEEVLRILKGAGFSRHVESFRQNIMDYQEYEEEGEQPGVNLDSLKAVARFLVNHRPPYSDIDMDADGNVGMEWLLSSSQGGLDPDAQFWGEGEGYMAIRFVSSKAIEFAMLSGPWHEGKERMNVSGRFSHSKINTIVEMFAGRMVEYA